MRRLTIVLLLGIAALTQMAPTCGNDFGRKGAGEPCTRDNECAENLVCSGGMWEEASMDGGGVSDAGDDASD